MGNLAYGSDFGGGGGAGFALGPEQNTFGDTSMTVTQARALRTTYENANAAWLGRYDNNGALMTRLLHTGSPGATFEVRANSAWVDVTAAIQGNPGADGSPGTPGGGAWDSVGTYAHTADDHDADIFVATGLTIPANRTVLGYRLAGTQANLDINPGILPFSATVLLGKTAAAAGDTSAAASRVHLPEFSGGGSISGSIFAGYTSANELLIATSNDDQDFAIELFQYVPSAVQARRTDAEIQAIIDATPVSNLQGQVTDAMVPDEFFRDAEFTAAAVRTQLGLTATEAEELLTGTPTISGDTITFTRNDGTSQTISLSAFLSESEFSAQRGNRLYLGTPVVYDETANTLAVTMLPAIKPAIGDHVLIIAPTTIGDDSDAVSIVEKVTSLADVTLPLRNDDNVAIGVNHLQRNRVYSLIRLSGHYRILEPLDEDPLPQTTIAVGWTADQTAEASELTATAMAHEVTIPTSSAIEYLALWTADSQGTLSGIFLGGSNINSITTYGSATPLELNGVAGSVRVTISQRVGTLVSGLVIRVEF